MKLNVYQIYRISFTILIAIITIVIPSINYFNFKTSFMNIDCLDCANQVNLRELESTFDILIYFFIVAGFIISICSYYVFKFQKYSITRGLLLLIITVMYMIYFIVSSQMSIVLIEVSKIQIFIDFSGVSILFIIVISLYAVKDLYDLIDFKVNQSYYISILRAKKTEPRKPTKLEQRLVKCPECKYACRIGWRKCPICKTKI